MEILQTKPGIKNINLMLVVVGILTLPAINGAESLILGLLQLVIDYSLGTRLYVAFIFEALCCCAFAAVIFLILKKERHRPFIELSTTKLKTMTVIFLILIVAGRTLSYFFLSEVGEKFKALEYSDQEELLLNKAYLQIAVVGISVIRDIILFVIMFLIVRQNMQTSGVADDRETTPDIA